MKKQRITARLKELHQNDGRLGWLPSNPRQWTKDDIRRTKESLERDPDFLEDRPVLLVSCENGFIVFAGNLRCTAAKEAKLKSVPAVVYEPENDEDRETIKRRSILDNGSFGSWDFDALANEWDDIPLTDFGVPAWDPDAFGGSSSGEGGAHGPGDATEDDFDENDNGIQARCKPGDIWQLGDHRLMCGDSTNADDFEKLMDGNTADITMTSPPYNAHHLDIAASKERGGGTQKCTQKKYLADDDKRTDEEYQTFLESNVSLLLKHSNEIFYNIGVCAGSKRTIVRLLNTFINEFKELLYWEKTNPMPVIAKGVISSSVELVIAFGKNNSRSFANFDNVLFHGVINGQSAAATNKYADIHKATFPVYLPSEIITNFTPDGGSVLDCFGGTGTTMIAAEQLNRRCYMMELDPRYCDVILARWEKFTGKKATRIE